MSDYTGQFGKVSAMLGQFQFGGLGAGRGVPGEMVAVEGRQRWFALARAVGWIVARNPVRWLLRARRMTNV